MREFFRSWKRKMGCVTLLLACILVAGWIKSEIPEVVGDALWFPSETIFVPFDRGHRAVEFSSFRGRVFARYKRSILAEDRFGATPHWSVMTLAPHEVAPDTSRYGFEYFAELWGYNHPEEIRGVELPYWSIVIPLNLISAYLLVSKPRSAERSESN